MKCFVLFLFCTILSFSLFSQQTDTLLLKRLMASCPQIFKTILVNPKKNAVQILYTQINRDKKNIPHFEFFSFNLNTNTYFYPASTVKLPTAIFALEKINQLNKIGLTSKSKMITDSDFVSQTKVSVDTLSKDGFPSVENYIKRILLVSDNDAYNRLYEFIDRKTLNEKLKQHGILHSRIVSRLAVGDKGETARHTNLISFFSNNKIVYVKPSAYDSLSYPIKMENMFQGNGYLDHGKLIDKPFDFSEMNIYPVIDQQLVLRKLIFPEAFKKTERYDLKGEDYVLIYKYMSMYPTESKNPTLKSPEYYSSYCKFLFYGGVSTAKIEPNIRIFNKVGDSYGYDIDNAYIVDFSNKVEFLLTAVIQSNEDGILNDNKYEYATICLPFLKNLGQIIYHYELKRKKKYLPDLTKFTFNY